MKKNVLILILCGLTILTKAQDPSVENSIWGIQTGFLGVWVHNEYKLSNEIALRSEIGFDSGIFGGSHLDNTGFVLVPTITVEPRWYYNLDKRNSKSKNIKNNSGNYFSVPLNYIPDWFVISNYNNVYVNHQITLIPMWGMKRSIGNHFNYEIGAGFGIGYVFVRGQQYVENYFQGVLDLHLRIGYVF